jgi:hypothetical protein
VVLEMVRLLSMDGAWTSASDVLAPTVCLALAAGSNVVGGQQDAIDHGAILASFCQVNSALDYPSTLC